MIRYLRHWLQLVLILLIATPAQGQWVLDLTAGQVDYDAAAATAETPAATLGVRYADSGYWGYLTAGAPLQSDSPTWGAGGIGIRLPVFVASLDAGADLGAELYGYSDPVTEVTGGGGDFSAAPFVRLPIGSDVVAELTSGVRAIVTSFDTISDRRLLSESGASLTANVDPAVNLTVEGRLVYDGDAGYPRAGASASFLAGPATVSVGVGKWFNDLVDGSEWDVNGYLPVHRNIALTGTFAHIARDPVFWNQERQRWSLGISTSLGAPLRRPPLTVPAIRSSGSVEVRIPARSGAPAPAIGGDFSEWQPIPMRRDGNEWAVTLSLDPGVYRYAFQRADGGWFVPDSVAGKVDDGFGGEVATLVVSAQ